MGQSGCGIHFTGRGLSVDAFCAPASSRFCEPLRALQVYLEPGEPAITMSTSLEVIGARYPVVFTKLRAYKATS